MISEKPVEEFLNIIHSETLLMITFKTRQQLMTDGMVSKKMARLL